MSSSQPLILEKSRRPMGRPRRLSLRQVIDAGIEMGLENLSISAVAAKLGVGLGTIYTYVENRDELARLVAMAMAKRQPMADVGQHWSDIVRMTARSTFTVMSDDPGLLGMIVSGAMEADEALPDLENFIAMLVRRGFTSKDAFELYRSSAQVAAGAAVVAATIHSWERQGRTRRLRLAVAFAEARPDAYPHIKSLGEAFTVDEDYTDYLPAIERLIAHIALDRGETLPPPVPSEGKGLTGND